MKSLRHILLITALTIAAFCSCSKVEQSVSGEEVSVSYTVSVPATKTVSDNGSSINKVWYALYKTDGKMATNYAPVDFVGGSARCEVVMMRGQSYKIVFVAQYYKDSVTPTYPIDAPSACIGVPTSPVANSDEYDLFYGTDDVVAFDGTPNGSIALERAVAMLNFVCSDEDWTGALVRPTHSSVSLSGAAAGWDLLAGAPVSETTDDLTFAKAPIPEDKHIGSVFFFANGDVDATLNLYDSADENAAPLRTVNVSDIQVETNKKTNVVGGLIAGNN